MSGVIKLIVEGQEHEMTKYSRPVTIEAGEQHSITGLVESIILEISTKHDDSDVTRLEESRA